VGTPRCLDHLALQAGGFGVGVIAGYGLVRIGPLALVLAAVFALTVRLASRRVSNAWWSAAGGVLVGFGGALAPGIYAGACQATLCGELGSSLSAIVLGVLLLSYGLFVDAKSSSGDSVKSALTRPSRRRFVLNGLVTFLLVIAFAAVYYVLFFRGRDPVDVDRPDPVLIIVGITAIVVVFPIVRRLRTGRWRSRD
jgi:hypothetical protein